MKFTEFLTTVYPPDFNEDYWIENNNYVFWAAREHGLALAGSIAIAVSRKKAVKKPGDIDLVASNLIQAFQFIYTLQEKLLTYKAFWNIRVNNRTDFCPPGSTCHIRFMSPFWMNICVMVIPEENFKIWRSSQGMMIQDFNSILSAAKAMDERDGKNRIEQIEEPDKSIKVHIPIFDEFMECDSDDEPVFRPEPNQDVAKWDVTGWTAENLDQKNDYPKGK